MGLVNRSNSGKANIKVQNAPVSVDVIVAYYFYCSIGDATVELGS